jgi:deferrochelatase/peroxidase EfeB
MYPRDDLSPGDDRVRRIQTEKHRILRRGLRYREPDTGAEGLLFLAYQTEFEEQFEWLLWRMANNPMPPGSSCPPGLVGLDPIVGQRRAPGRATTEDFPIMHEIENSDGSGTVSYQAATVHREEPWVLPTGGEYFFVPSKDALEFLASHGRAD